MIVIAPSAFTPGVMVEVLEPLPGVGSGVEEVTVAVFATLFVAVELKVTAIVIVSVAPFANVGFVQVTVRVPAL